MIRKFRGSVCGRLGRIVGRAQHHVGSLRSLLRQRHQSQDTPPRVRRGSISTARAEVRQKRVPVVYTMGKVASSSMSLAIERGGLTCYDVHSLDVRYLGDTARKHLAKDEFPPRHVCISMAYRNRLLGTSIFH